MVRVNVVKLKKESPSPAGEGRGEENKIRRNAYLIPSSQPSPRGRRGFFEFLEVS